MSRYKIIKLIVLIILVVVILVSIILGLTNSNKKEIKSVKKTDSYVVNKDVLQEKEYQGFTIHKSGYYPIYPYKGEPMEIKTIELS